MLSNRMIRKGMDFSIMSAVLWSGFAAATTGPVLAGLFLVLKLSNFQIGLVNSMTMLVLPAQVVGAVVQQRYFPRKPFWFWMAFSQYTCFLLIFVLMMLWGLIDHRYAVTVFITLFAMAQMAAQMGASVWMSWMSDLVPARESNNFWNRRGGLAQASMLVSAICVGLLIDKLGRELLSTYMWMYITGVAFGYLSLFTQSAVPEPAPGTRPSSQPVWLKLRLTWRNERFRQLLAFFGLHSLSNWLVAPFIFIYLQQTLNFSMTTVQLLVASSSTVSFFSAYAFRVIGRKYGRKPVALLCAFMKGLEFVGWGLLIPGATWRWALPVFILGGFVNMGLGNATLSLLGSVEKRKNQSFTIAVFFAVTGLLGFAGAGMSGICMDALGSLTWAKACPLSAFNLMSLVVALGYFSSVLLFLKFREEGSISTVRVVKTLLANNPFRSVYHAHILSRPMPEMTRIETLAQAKGNLIVSELISDLYNPSPRVRDSAIRNIARNGEKADPLLEEELIKILDMAEFGVQSATVRALGMIRSQKAAPLLVKYLRGGDMTLAQSCLFALGQIGYVQAADELQTLLTQERYRVLWPSASEALGKLGSYRHTRRLFRIYQSEYNWILKKQVLIAVVRTMVADKQYVYDCFENEEKQPGAASEKILKNLRTMAADTIDSEQIRIIFSSVLADFDAGFYPRGLERLMRLLSTPYQAAGENPFLLEMSNPRVKSLFGAEGVIRHAPLLRDDPVTVSLWLQLMIWAEMKYAPGNMDRFLFLAALLNLEGLMTISGPLDKADDASTRRE